jgi:hypothetical protein
MEGEMPLSHFPHGVFATPNIGAGRLVDLWNSSNVWFVDGDNGRAGNAGNEPSKAVALPSTAVNKASQWGTVYIRPMQNNTYATITNDYYVDNITVPISKAGLSIVGAGPGGSHYQSVEMKTAVAGSHLITIYAPAVHIEGIRLTGTSQTAVTGLANPDLSIIRAMGDGTTNKSNGGLSISNCTFSNAKAGGAVRIDNPWNCTIDNSIFHNCFVGVWTSSSVSSTNGMWIKNCQFEGQPANIDAYIYMTGGSANCYGGLIHNCTFQGTVPAHASGSIKRYISVGDTWTTGAGGLIANCFFGLDADNSSGLCDPDGTQVIIPATWAAVACYGFFQTETENGMFSDVD